ncbi:hypothetical protein M947_01970 [Sulfurimonas hongkongensis]|uniref:Copper chaperone NosL n=1 Tax=Sulfurimonas hongkongensis TaxID=1172190 RepID=T0JHK5_9BACT|nr:hypothetical protein [Sulfurimonas hongkongensis]EQB40595.1 hypothetical protein M947_01970 [Sulfurimonas hongkongensis]
MKSFNLLLILAISFFTACNSTQHSGAKEPQSDSRVCPKCHMELDKSNAHSASIVKNNSLYYFDDIGCLILWSHENKLDAKSAKVFTKDSARYIDATKAHYKIGEKTPMSYGFVAFENSIEETIDFDEVRIKMLRGEHMANPKIRKQILGY